MLLAFAVGRCLSPYGEPNKTRPLGCDRFLKHGEKNAKACKSTVRSTDLLTQPVADFTVLFVFLSVNR